MHSSTNHSAKKDIRIGLGSCGFMCAWVSILAAILLIAASPTGAQVSVPTARYNNQRSAVNNREKILTPSNVRSGTFGKLFSQFVDGDIYAQPLYLPNVNISGAVHNVVFVATGNDSVYAFDADSNGGANAHPIWQTNFLSPGVTTSSDSSCNSLDGAFGITGTPVIDPSTETMFVVAETIEDGGSANVKRLHALDITSGLEKPGSPIVISASATVPGQGEVTFDGRWENQRAGLLLYKGVVYVAFAPHCMERIEQGWILGYSYDESAFRQVFVFPTDSSTAQEARGAGLIGGETLLMDESSNLFVRMGSRRSSTANVPVPESGDSIVRLDISQGPKVQDYFTAATQSVRDNQSQVLGSGGILILPDQPGPDPHLAILADKFQNIYVVNRDNLGHSSSSGNNIVQQFKFDSSTLLTAPVYFDGKVYFSGADDAIRTYTMADGLLSGSSTDQTDDRFEFPGAVPTISSNGTSDAVLWAITSRAFSSNASAVLYAYDPTNLGAGPLYNSDQNSSDNPGGAIRFAVPTVADGKVYVGAAGQLSVFGSLPTITGLSPASGPPGTTVAITGTNFGSTQGTSTVTFNGTAATVTSWSATTLVTSVPTKTTTGSVEVTVGGIASNHVNFTVLTKSSTMVATAAPADSDTAGKTSRNLAIAQQTTGVAGTFTLVQQVGVHVCNGSTTCNIKVAATGSNDLLVVTAGSAAGTSSLVTGVSGGGTWAAPTACQTSNGNWGSVSCAYNLSSTSGATTITLTLSNTNTYNVEFWEYSFTSSSASLDALAATQQTGNGSTVSGVNLTLGGSNDVILQWSECNATAVAAPYGDLKATTNTAFADNENSINVAATNMWSTTYSRSSCGQAGIAFAAISSTVPTITSLSTASGAVGAPVTITGTNFGSTQGSSTVTFNGTAATVTSWNAASLVTSVPAGATTGNVVVTIGGVASNGVNFTVVPTASITTLSVTSGPVGTPVTITGTNFGSTQGSSTLTFNGTAATVTSWSAASLVTSVPTGATTGNVVVTVGGVASNGVNFTVVPTPRITSLSTTSGPVGTPVTITGTNFGSTQGASTVAFNGTAATVTSWSATSLVASVPTGATTGSVVVTVGGVASNGVNFTVTLAGAGTFTLVQQVGVHVCNGSTTCNIKVAATGSNDLLVVTAGSAAGTSSLVTGVSGGGTWAAPTACQTSNGNWGSVSCAYNLSSTSGATTITLTLSNTNTYNVEFWEYSFTSSSASLDALAATQQTGNGSTVSGVNLTLGGSNDVILQWSECNATAVAPPYGHLKATTNTAFADNENSINVAATNMWSTTYSRSSCGQAGIAFAATGSTGSTVATPTFSPGAGTYASAQTVTISSATSGATLCYTTNGATPAANTPGTCSTGTALANGGTVTVSVSETLQAIGTESDLTNSAVGSAAYVITGVTPSITSLSTTSGPVGTPVTITGTNFGSAQGSSTVTFNGTAATVTSWSASSLVTSVPTGATTGNVVVTVGGVASNGVNFTVTPSGGSSTFTIVQQVGVQNCAGSTTCSIKIAATGSNHLLVMTAGSASGTPSFVTGVSGGGTWTVPTGCQISNGDWGSVNCAYALSSTSGATTITLTLSNSNSFHVVFWEYSFTAPSTSLDAIGAAQLSGNGSHVSGVNLGLSGSNDAILQWSECNATAVAPPYGHYIATSTGAFADNENSINVAATNMWSTTYTLTVCGLGGLAFK